MPRKQEVWVKTPCVSSTQRGYKTPLKATKSSSLNLPHAAAAPPSSRNKGNRVCSIFNPSCEMLTNVPQVLWGHRAPGLPDTATLPACASKLHHSLPGIFSRTLLSEDKFSHLQTSPDQLFFLHRCSRTELSPV